LSSTAHRSIMEYDKMLDSYVSQHKLLSKSHMLYRTANGPLSQDQQDLFESIDRVKSKGMVHVDKKCRKFHMGEVDYSPDVNTARG
jgi:hypothetical protein